MITTYRTDTARQTLVWAEDGGLPWACYWGPPLAQDTDLDAMAQAAQMTLTGGMIDTVPPLSICPEATTGFDGQPGLIAYGDDGLLQPKFVALDVQDGVRRYEDAALGLVLDWHIAPQDDGMIRTWVTLEAAQDITVHHLAAPALPGPQSGDILHFSGRWIGEFQPQRSPWQPGMLKREARGGRSGHEHPPLAFFCETGATHAAGMVFGMHLAHPGGHVMIAEELADGRRQIQWGKATGSQERGRRFDSAPLLICCSEAGLNGCAVQFQRHLRDTVITWPKPDQPRPVHYNCWEAVYFDHDLSVLKDIAQRAADLGAERFVLDDGWFGIRDDDTTGLGDWQIDRRKWPDGLTPLIDHVQSLGMGFGLWFEPEMVNMDSDLARAHPEWVLGRADQIEGRQQRVLDMAKPEVRDHLFDAISAILSAYDIEYVKWDHNRLLPVSDAAQADGVLDLMGRLRAAFPLVEIESCASGGGRIDAGILTQTQRVWLSDSNDALERLRIQHDAALFLPAAVTGSHVGPRVCHTSGRQIDMRMRAWVAAQRHMGFEMDPRELTEDEARVLTHVTAWWKSHRHWRMQADILRLDSGDPAVIGEQQMAQDGSQFVVFAGRAATSGHILPRPLRLTGLDPEARYEIALVNADEAHRLARRPVALQDGPLTLRGAVLMRSGINLPWAFPDTMWVLEGKRV